MAINIKSITRRWTFIVAGLLTAVLGFGGTTWAQSRETIPAGTTIGVRTNDTIDTRSNDGQVFRGTVDQDVLGRNGYVVIPRGSDAELVVRRVSENELALDLDSVEINGERFGIETSSAVVDSRHDGGIGVNERTGKYVGGGAILGAIIGGIAGGGKGAAIGAGAGAAAGAGAQILTRGRRIEVPAESLVTFQLTEPLRAGMVDHGYQRNGYHYHEGQGSLAYEQGIHDGRADAERGISGNMRRRQFVNWRDRQDYQDGYNAGFQTPSGYDNGRQKPGYSGSPWSISIGRNRTVTWQSPDTASIYVQVDNGPQKLFASGQAGTQGAPWIQAGHLYVFILKDENGREIARTQQDLR